MIQLIVSGSRHATPTDCTAVCRELDLIHANEPIALIIEGGARGVDACASRWALACRVPSVAVLANWDKYGKAAGHIRNGWMLKRYPEARVLAFPKGPSPGTRNCIEQAQALGREPRIVELKP